VGAPFKTFFGLRGITQPFLLVQGVDVKAGPTTKGRCPIQDVFWLDWDNTAFAAGTGSGCESWPDNKKGGAPFKPFLGLSGITQPFLLVQGVDVKAGPTTKGRCPIQAVFGLEWDNAAFAAGTVVDERGRTADHGVRPSSFTRSLPIGVI
jgi:hypothetical protein